MLYKLYRKIRRHEEDIHLMIPSGEQKRPQLKFVKNIYCVNVKLLLQI